MNIGTLSRLSALFHTIFAKIPVFSSDTRKYQEALKGKVDVDTILHGSVDEIDNAIIYSEDEQRRLLAAVLLNQKIPSHLVKQMISGKLAFNYTNARLWN